MRYYFSDQALTDVLYYCPGCTHGIIHRLIAEVLMSLACRRYHRVAPVDCAVFAGILTAIYGSAHGRVRCHGIKQATRKYCFTYQGDRDCRNRYGGNGSCGRKERNITVIFVNNTYGMTATITYIPCRTGNTNPVRKKG